MTGSDQSPPATPGHGANHPSSKPYTEILPDDLDESGVHRRDLSQAVSTWAWMNCAHSCRQISVSEAAMAFNTTPDLIRQAVQDDLWTFLSPENEPDSTQQFIEHDGE